MEERMTLTVKVPKDIHKVIKLKMANEDMKIQEYLFGLILSDLGIETEA